MKIVKNLILLCLILFGGILIGCNSEPDTFAELSNVTVTQFSSHIKPPYYGSSLDILDYAVIVFNENKEPVKSIYSEDESKINKAEFPYCARIYNIENCGMYKNAGFVKYGDYTHISLDTGNADRVRDFWCSYKRISDSEYYVYSFASWTRFKVISNADVRIETVLFEVLDNNTLPIEDENGYVWIDITDVYDTEFKNVTINSQELLKTFYVSNGRTSFVCVNEKNCNLTKIKGSSIFDCLLSLKYENNKEKFDLSLDIDGGKISSFNKSDDLTYESARIIIMDDPSYNNF